MIQTDFKTLEPHVLLMYMHFMFELNLSIKHGPSNHSIVDSLQKVSKTFHHTMSMCFLQAGKALN